MRNLALTLLVTGGMLAAAACDRDSGPQPRPNAQTPSGQSSQTSPSRQGPAAGQSARPGDLSPGGSQMAQANPSFDTADRDKNGTVDQAEASTVPGLNFSSADADKNESLSRQEFMTAMAGARPPG